MSFQLHSIDGRVPEHLLPGFLPAPSGPLNGTRPRDVRCAVDALVTDMKTALNWATSAQLAVLSINADRNGAYLVVAPSPRLKTLFGEECTWFHRYTDHGLLIEHWLGAIGHIRVFWREVTCVH